MKHQTLEGIESEVTVTMQLEDWAWLCDMLAETLKQPGNDQYTREDTQHILNVLESAERSL